MLETAVAAFLRKSGIPCVVTGMLDDAAQTDGQVSVYGTKFDVQVGADYLALNLHEKGSATDYGTFKPNAQGLNAIVTKLKELMAKGTGKVEKKSRVVRKHLSK